MENDEDLFIERLNQDVQNQGQFYDVDDPKEIFDRVQEDFQASSDRDILMETVDTFEGTSYVFRNGDGDIRSYFKNNDDQVIRSKPSSDVINVYGKRPAPEPKSASEGLMTKIFGEKNGRY